MTTAVTVRPVRRLAARARAQAVRRARLAMPRSTAAAVPRSAAGVVCRALVVAVAAALVLLTMSALTGPGQTAVVPSYAELSTWNGDAIDGRALPDLQASTPAELGAFLSALDPAGQRTLAERYPEVVGNLDGAPYALRYAANRLAMAAAAAPLRQRAAELGQRVTDLSERIAAADGAGPWQAFERWRDGRELRAATAQRDRVGQAAANVAAWAASERQFLLFDPRGDGRVAEVIGDLEHAEMVSVVVPGADQHLGNFEQPLDPGAPVGAVPLRNLKALRRAVELLSPGAAAAHVAWLGYDTPEGLGRESSRSERAAAGARALPEFVAALDPDGDRRVSVLCHSYGSVVCGLAARNLAVDEVVVFGSPGMGVAEAAELDGRARVWAGLAEGDAIAMTPQVLAGGLGHGAQPVSADFGAQRFGALGAAGHADYYGQSTESLANLARIVLGRTGEVTCDQASVCDADDAPLIAAHPDAVGVGAARSQR